MDISSKLYIDYLYDNNKYYDDEILKKEITEMENKFKENLTAQQLLKFEEINKAKQKLRRYQDLRLISYIVENKDK